MMKQKICYKRKVLLGIVLVGGILFGLYLAVQSKCRGVPYSFHYNTQFNSNLDLLTLLSAFWNPPHLLGFFALSLVGLLFFENKEYLKTFLLVILVTILCEMLQMWAPTRHARLVDIIPNLYGYAFAAYTRYAILLRMVKYASAKGWRT